MYILCSGGHYFEGMHTTWQIVFDVIILISEMEESISYEFLTDFASYAEKYDPSLVWK